MSDPFLKAAKACKTKPTKPKGIAAAAPWYGDFGAVIFKQLSDLGIGAALLQIVKDFEAGGGKVTKEFVFGEITKLLDKEIAADPTGWKGATASILKYGLGQAFIQDLLWTYLSKIIPAGA